MSNFSQRKYQDAVLWTNAGTDDFGNPIVNGPKAIKVRIEDGYEASLDSEGNIVESDMLVGVGEKIEPGSLFYQGTLASIGSDPIKLLEVKKYQEYPNLHANKFDRWIKLKYSSTVPSRVQYSMSYSGTALTYSGETLYYGSTALTNG